MPWYDDILALDQKYGAGPSPATASDAAAPVPTAVSTPTSGTEDLSGWADPVFGAQMMALDRQYGSGAHASAATTSAPQASAPAAAPSGTGKNIAVGMVEGAGDALNVLSDPFGNLIGRPLATVGVLAHDLVAPHFGGKAFTPQERAELLDDGGDQVGTRAVNAGARAIGAPTPDQVSPSTGGAAMARDLTRAATGAALLGPGAGVRGALGDAVAGAAGMAGGHVADQAVPESSIWRPTAEMVGQAAGVGAGAGGIAASHGVGRAVSDAGRLAMEGTPLTRREPIVDPATGLPVSAGPDGAPRTASPWVMQTAAREYAAKAGKSPAELADAIPEQPSPLPGAMPTTGQVTGNTAALAYERKLRGLDYGRAAFTDAEARNNTAIGDTLNGLAPADAGNAMRDFVRSRLDALHRQGDDEAADAQGTAEAARDKIGGTDQPMNYGQAMQEHIASHFAPAFAKSDAEIAAAREGVGQGLDAVGGNPDTTDVQAFGRQQRDPMVGQRQDLKAQAKQIYDAIDPEGKLMLDASAIGRMARQIKDEEIGLGGELSAPEHAPLAGAAVASGVFPFKRVRELASNVGHALRTIRDSEGVEAPAYRRMSMLQDAIHGTLSDAAGERAASDAEAVASGRMAPEDSIMGHLQGDTDARNAAGRTAAPLQTDVVPAAGGIAGSGNPNARAARMGSRILPAGSGEEVPQAWGSGAAQGDQGLSEASGGGEGQAAAVGAHEAIHGTTPAAAAAVAQMTDQPQLRANFNEAARLALRRANVFYRNNVIPFREGAVGRVMASGPNDGFRLASSAVPAALFVKGPAGAEAADSLIRATKSVEAAQQVLGEGPAYSLRLAAEKDGTLSAAPVSEMDG
ncbi:hypothetical protein [Gluconacetobacter diazotrophicus]|uniref:hypothetical protein n=1 Tax=Gluconacetobacter diazotrophicus TaxID=33996 RepID=UPI00059DE2B3|nr:hypothetical protein [Gluconacetobacter diazotrophicus]